MRRQNGPRHGKAERSGHREFMVRIHGKAAQLIVPLFVLFACAKAYAADQATLDRLVEYAKQGCLSGNQFDLHADVNGNVIFKNLLKPGAEGSATVNVRNSAGATAIFEQQLRLVADQQIRDCMKPYIDRIFQSILGSGPQITPASPSKSALPSAEKVQGAAAPVHIALGDWWDVSLYRCVNAHENTICYFTIKKATAGISDFNARSLAGNARLVDNFQINHRMVRAYFINGRNQEQETAPVGKDNSIWLAIEFEGSESDITSAQIVLKGNVFAWPKK